MLRSDRLLEGMEQGPLAIRQRRAPSGKNEAFPLPLSARKWLVYKYAFGELEFQVSAAELPKGSAGQAPGSLICLG